MMPQPPAPRDANAQDLLAWYDRHRRVMPWRAPAGMTQDPYRVWLSEVMLQQTTVQAVKPYFEAFTTRWPTVDDLATASIDEVMGAWSGLGYYSRARNLHACAKAVVERHGGLFPDSVDGLRQLPGIGAYTAAAIAAIAYRRPAAVVDGNVERVVTRLDLIDTPLPAAKPAITNRVAALLDRDRPGDFAQAMMDLGATICTPKRPACALCPWQTACRARAEGTAESFPVKAPKARPVGRRGAAFVVVRTDGAIMVRTRPPKGLLGGTVEVPGSDWSAGMTEAGSRAAAPPGFAFRRLEEPVLHVFTHFPLELVVYRAEAKAGTPAPEGLRWLGAGDIASAGLSTLMRKVVARAMDGPGKGSTGRPMRR